ncbi:sigma-54-dependent Fis family transcriptional regulator [candidate division KSB1 bacterium]|nr:sigma-54-dependent Fis family transcriptional regulator [candidate division KSB1 bacterium]
MRLLNAILIDDDSRFSHTFKDLAKGLFEVTIAHNSKAGFKQIEKNHYDVVFLDYKLKEAITGLDVLKEIRRTHPDLPVIMITEYENIDLAVEAMRLGAFDFTTKKPDIKNLRVRLENMLQQDNWRLLCQIKDEMLYGEVIYKSPAMAEIMNQIQQVAPTDYPVLLLGESGSGKNVLAHAIHRCSPRANRKFVEVNCSTLASELFESTLFGHRKGAFTNAFEDKRGYMELANMGTLFLDEIAAMPLTSQAKVLTALEDKTFFPVGTDELQTSDFRIIVATNAKLKDEIEKNTFRNDLFYRLNGFKIEIPPLRERPEDIIPLAEHFLKKQTFPHIKTITDAIKKNLLQYHWPGNVRELRNVIQSSLLFCHGDELDKLVLDAELPKGLNYCHFEELYQVPYETAKNQIVDHFQKLYFTNLLKVHSDNISAAAEAAQINRTTLYRIMKELGLEGFKKSD